MQTNNFTITNHIINWQTNQSIAGLCIETRDKDILIDYLAGNADTDAKGFFDFRFIKIT